MDEASDSGEKDRVLDTQGQISECFLVTPCMMLSSIVPEEAEQIHHSPKTVAVADRTTPEFSPSLVQRLSTPEKIILDHQIPKKPTRTNVVTEDQVPRSRLFGAFCTRGCGITQSTTQYPQVVKACLDAAATRKYSYPFAAMQLTTHTYLPCHQDKNNFGYSWIIGLGEYSGGYHSVEPVTSSRRVSLTLFTPKGMKKLADHHLQDLDELGFPMSDFVADTVTPEVYPDKAPDAGTPEVPIDTPLPPVPAPELKLNTYAHLEGVGVSVSNGDKTPFTPEELTELKEHIQGGHLTKSHLCRACVLGSGPLKYHRPLHPDDRMSHCLHMDLAGPFAASVDCYKYFMVGVLRLPDFPLLFQVELLETRGAPEIAQA
eukprot:5228263-Amphidinium_carterae.1